MGNHEEYFQQEQKWKSSSSVNIMFFHPFLNKLHQVVKGIISIVTLTYPRPLWVLFYEAVYGHPIWTTSVVSWQMPSCLVPGRMHPGGQHCPPAGIVQGALYTNSKGIILLSARSNMHIESTVCQEPGLLRVFKSKSKKRRKLYLTSDSVDSTTLALTWNEC